MKIKAQYLDIGGERMVILSAREFERLSKKADVWLPPMPTPNERGNYPLESLAIFTARDIILTRRKLGLTQAELASRAGIRLATLDRIENGKHLPNVRIMEKIDRALKQGETERNGHRMSG